MDGVLKVAGGILLALLLVYLGLKGCVDGSFS